MSEPGKTSRVSQIQGPTPDVATPTGIPGKSTLVGASTFPVSAADIDTRYARGEAHCDDPNAAGCFLDKKNPAIRPRLIADYKERVGTAQLQYQLALQELKFEELIKKDEELPAILSMVLDAIGVQLVSALGKAFKAFQGTRRLSADLAWLADLQSGVLDETKHHTALELVRSARQSDVEIAIKAGVDLAKGKGKSGLTPGPADEKQAALSYYDQLREKSVIAFQYQKEGPPGEVGDAELILLYKSFDAKMGHTVGHYKAALQDQYDRFKSSAASKIGRHQVPASPAPGKYPNEPLADPNLQLRNIRDLKVAWVQYPDGTKVLKYYKRDFRYKPTMTDEQRRPGFDGRGMDEIDAHFVPAENVEAEFVDTAIAKHKEMWGTDPETKKADSSENNLNQFVPQNNPKFNRIKPARPIEDLNQFVPANNPDFEPVYDEGDPRRYMGKVPK